MNPHSLTVAGAAQAWFYKRTCFPFHQIHGIAILAPDNADEF